MAENSTSKSEAKTKKRDPPAVDADGPPEEKIAKVEKAVEPPPKQYKEIRKLLQSLKSQSLNNEKNPERIVRLLTSLEEICREQDGALMVIQMHLKNVLFNSKGLKDGDNIKMFLNSIEDGSECKSDKDDSVYIFYANHATALWYQWQNDQWHWTPESSWWLWMPCSEVKVSKGQWKGEIPAPENVEIINYLDAVRPVTSDQVYLSDQYDISVLFNELLKVDEAKEKVASIATILKDQKVISEDRGGHIESLSKAMQFIIEAKTNN